MSNPDSSSSDVDVDFSPRITDDSLPRGVFVDGTEYGKKRLLGKGGIVVAAAVYQKMLPGPGMPFIVVKKIRNMANDNLANEMLETDAYVSSVLSGMKTFVLNDIRCVVVPYHQGQTLESIVCDAEGGPIPADILMHICFKVASKLQTLHSHTPKIVHSDFKLGNTMITSEGQPEPIDFNSSYIQGVTSEPKGLRGTADCMAPEQWFNGAENPIKLFGELSDKTDVYALGHSLYRALTGTSLARGHSVAASKEMHIHGLRWPAQRGKSFEGRFSYHLDVLGEQDRNLRFLLEHMLMTEQSKRLSMEAVIELSRDECLRRGIRPSAPLFPPLQVEPGSEVEASVLAKAIKVANTKRTINISAEQHTEILPI